MTCSPVLEILKAVDGLLCMGWQSIRGRQGLLVCLFVVVVVVVVIVVVVVLFSNKSE